MTFEEYQAKIWAGTTKGISEDVRRSIVLLCGAVALQMLSERLFVAERDPVGEEDAADRLAPALLVLAQVCGLFGLDMEAAAQAGVDSMAVALKCKEAAGGPLGPLQ